MPDTNIKIEKKIVDLLEIMSQLRDVEKGCPWDLGQSFETIAPYTIEEAYEVADAIQRKDLPALKSELGDLLFQVVFHAQLAKEEQAFHFSDVVDSICNKLTSRHPHVFTDQIIAKEDLAKQWEALKRDETPLHERKGVLAGVSVNQPAMNQAYKLQKKASSVGFDWDRLAPVIDKLDEEIDELKEEINIIDNQKRIEEELGDVLFSCVNLARHLDVNPEWSLRKANERFTLRFEHIESQLNTEGKDIESCSTSQLETLWCEAKLASKKTES